MVIAVLTTMRAVKWLTGMDLGHTIIARQKEDCYLRWGGGGEHVIFVILFETAGKLTFVHQLFLEFSLKCSNPCYLMWLTETTWNGMCESGDSEQIMLCQNLLISAFLTLIQFFGFYWEWGYWEGFETLFSVCCNPFGDKHPHILPNILK